MRHIAKIFFASLFFAGALSSCIEDKGNYDYNWVQPLELKLPELAPTDSIEVISGDRLTITPVFFDKNTGEEVKVAYDDYTFKWLAMPVSVAAYDYTRYRELLSNNYNLDAEITLPVNSEYNKVTLEAVNNKTGQFYRVNFYLKVTGRYTSAYLFITEEGPRQIGFDIYGWKPNGEVDLTRNFFPSTGFNQTACSSYGIMFDRPKERIFLLTDQTFTWLGSPDFDYLDINTIDNLLIPTTQTIFTGMHRLGGTGAGPTNRNIIFFSADGGVFNLANNNTINLDMAYVNGEDVVVAPMVAGYLPQRSSVYWIETKKKLGWASLYSMGSSKASLSLKLFDEGIGKDIDDCLYLGGSSDREMIAILRDVDGEYWRVDMVSEFVRNGQDMFYHPKLSPGSPRRLKGTASLGKIDHWINSHEKGYIYAIVGNEMYTYVEAQAGGVEDPGWSKAAITDSNSTPAQFTDPISFVHFENDGRNCMYVFTYSQTNGGTLYLLRPREVGADLELVDKITGLGNVKHMCYWWG